MNVYDSEIVAGILSQNQYEIASHEEDADIILVNGCTVRENADQRALSYIRQWCARKHAGNNLKIGLIGCLGQRLGSGLQETIPDIDLILGPDGYRELPSFLRNLPEKPYVQEDNVLEDYDDIVPVRKKGAGAWVAISRGCNNKCTYCVVPYVRGAERSRPVGSIISEVEKLIAGGFREVTLLGQNVNSYTSDGVDFPELLELVSLVPGIRRVRFTTSHPKDLSKKLVYIIRDRENICSHIHLPVQSGSDRMLQAMGREYTIEHYLSLIGLLKHEIPGISITTDIISGYPGETEQDHQATLDLLREVVFDGAFTFKYSPREGTPAFSLPDDVPEKEKVRRLNEVSTLQRVITARENQRIIGMTLEVMIETVSKRSAFDVLGRTDGGKNVVIAGLDYHPGTFCKVHISGASSQTLYGKAVEVTE